VDRASLSSATQKRGGNPKRVFGGRCWACAAPHRSTFLTKARARARAERARPVRTLRRPPRLVTLRSHG